MVRKGLVVAALLAVVSLVSGCGDDDDDGESSAPSADVVGDGSDEGESEAEAEGECALVDTATVTEAMGQEMELVLFYDEGCEWRAVADSAIQTFVTIIPEDEYRIEDAEPIEGIGDEAFLRSGIATQQVYFRIGDVRYEVDAGDLNSTASYEDAMIAIARAIAAAA